MDMQEARELISSPIWPAVRDSFLATGEFRVYPAGDLRRVGYLDAETRARIALWLDALAHADAWRTVLDGAKVRELKASYPGIYPEVFRYAPYFTKFSKALQPGASIDDPAVAEPLRLLLKLKFPEAYALCCC